MECYQSKPAEYVWYNLIFVLKETHLYTFGYLTSGSRRLYTKLLIMIRVNGDVMYLTFFYHEHI